MKFTNRQNSSMGMEVRIVTKKGPKGGFGDTDNVPFLGLDGG